MSIDEFIAEWQSSSPFIEAHTSGSTGQPKRILLSKELMKASARRSIDFFGLNENSRLHLPLAPDYIAGKMLIIRAMISGARLTHEPPTSAPLRENDDMSEITLLPVVPTQLKGLYEVWAQRRLPGIKHLLVGGAPMNAACAEWAKTIAENVWESYGMTETASHIAMRSISSPADLNAPFKLLPGIEISMDERSCLVIHLDKHNRLVTNDLVEMAGEDSFRLLGRIDHAIISGGLKVHPAQVEAKIAPLMKDYERWYISSLPDEKWGRKVVLFIEAAQIASSIEEAILRACAERLLAHARPRKIITIPKMPLTSSGKIIRQ